jgi:hypothetical protein
VIINEKQDLQDYVAAIMGDDSECSEVVAVVDGLLAESPPPYGSDDWGDFLDDHTVWLAAHTKYRFKEMRLDGIEASRHGRGVRITSEARGVDVVCFSFEEVDIFLAGLVS